MKIVLIGVGTIIALACVYWSIRFYHFYTISKGLVRAAVPYENRSGDFAKTLLVLGDSTAVGVGAASSSESVPAQVARSIGATYVENQAVSGAVVTDLPNEISKAARTQYDFLLVQIGANDITKFHGARATANKLVDVLATAPKATRVLVISAGNVGAATLLPEPIRPLYTHLNKQYHTEFGRVLSAEGYTYVDLSKGPGAELFTSKPEIYLAADGFHPSSAGYKLWFDAIQPYLSK
ncbi:MAG: family lipase [Parcubacteria group bacterium]|nr:family lipase [Parcubacteria group bacterium]